MVSNIVIVSLNREISRQVGEILAEELEMHFLDTIELFEFDNIPRSLSDILKENGEKYFREKEKSLTGYASGFENTVINIESGCCLVAKNIKKLKENCLVIYLHFPPNTIKKYLDKKNYETEELKKFYNITLKKIERRAEILSDKADIRISASNKSFLKLSSEVLRAINAYYLN